MLVTIAFSYCWWYNSPVRNLYQRDFKLTAMLGLKSFSVFKQKVTIVSIVHMTKIKGEF